MKRKLICVLLALALVSAMAPAMASAEDYTIKMMAIWSEADPLWEGSMLCDLAEEFCATHEGFDYEFEYCEQWDVPSKLSVLIASNDVPDIFFYEDGGSLDALVERDVLVDITEHFEDLGYTLEEVYSPAALSAKKMLSNYDHLYSLPQRITIEGIWYNKTIFEQYGLSVPTTWSELEAVCDTLLENGVQPLAAEGLSQFPITRWIMNYATRLAGNDVHLRASTNDGVRFDDDVFIQAATKIQEMFQKGYFGRGFNSIDDDAPVFLAGQCAMVYTGSWDVAAFIENAEGNIRSDEIGFFSVPCIEGSEISPEEAAKMNAVSTNLAVCFGKNKFDEGTNHEFLKYVVEELGNRQAAVGAYVAYNEDFLNVELDKSSSLNQIFYNVLENAEYSTLWFEAKMDTNSTDVALENGQLLAEGSMSPEEWCERLAEAVDERMAG